MYLGREHFETLLASPRWQGPRYLSNTTFAELLGIAWIGSRGWGSAYVGQQIADSIEAGRAVVAGIDRTPRTLRARRT